MKSKLFIPKENKVYRNLNGSSYKCIESSSEGTVFVNILSGWMFTAHEVRVYEDGRIDWDYSEGGHFVRL